MSHIHIFIFKTSKTSVFSVLAAFWYWPWHQAALGVSERSLVAELAFQVTPMQAWSFFLGSLGFIFEILQMNRHGAGSCRTFHRFVCMLFCVLVPVGTS